MGHAENRCEARFAMDSDDGIRNWSNDLRADPRRLAGRQTSRWLLDERSGSSSNRGGGGGPTTRGGGVFREARQNSDVQSMQGPTNFNVQNNSIGNQIIPSHNSQPNPIIPIQCPAFTTQKTITTNPQSLPINSPLIPGPAVTSSVTSQPLPPPSLVFRASLNSQSQPSRARRDVSKPTPSFQSSTNHHPTLIPSVHVIPPPNLPFTQTIIEPITIFDPTSQNTSPSQTHNLTHHSNILQISPSPNLSLTRHNIKPNNTLHYSLGSACSTEETVEPEEMEIHVERKRRRDDEAKKNSVIDATNQHFLSAGPGSQDCREQ
ncbi:hypothetical protein P8452_27859 [Trifolium repens]|nr:hypothetical protein P8452_27859 [Trifolium repens]